MGGHPQGKFFTLPFIHSLKIFPLASANSSSGLIVLFRTLIRYPKKGEPLTPSIYEQIDRLINNPET
jgi:hypothetical protein